MHARHTVALLVFTTACGLVQAGDPPKPERLELQMSPALKTLFQEEMRDLLTGIQAVAAAVPAGDWKGIVVTSAMMQHSYVLEKQLTSAQEEELSRLPEDFKALDEAFHLRAGKLEHAATARDAEATAFQFSRLLETCTTCHAKFAQTRFPALGTISGDAHHRVAELMRK